MWLLPRRGWPPLARLVGSVARGGASKGFPCGVGEDSLGVGEVCGQGVWLRCGGMPGGFDGGPNELFDGPSHSARLCPVTSDATFNTDRHVLTQPTALRPQPADLLVLLDRDRGGAASAIPGGCTVEPSSAPPRETYASQHARRQHLLTTGIPPGEEGSVPSGDGAFSEEPVAGRSKVEPHEFESPAFGSSSGSRTFLKL